MWLTIKLLRGQCWNDKGWKRPMELRAQYQLAEIVALKT